MHSLIELYNDCLLFYAPLENIYSYGDVNVIGVEAFARPLHRQIMCSLKEDHGSHVNLQSIITP